MNHRVLIVDDHPSFRSLARVLLSAEGFEVIGEASDVRGALTAAEELQPDVVLLDVHLPDGNGYEATARLRTAPGAPVVILTSTHEPEDVEPLASASGAAGFIAKHELSGERITALLA